MYIHCIPVWKDLKVFFDLLFFNIKISKNNKKELIFNKIYGIVVKSEKGCGQIMNQRLIRFTKLVLDLMFYGGFSGVPDTSVKFKVSWETLFLHN